MNAAQDSAFDELCLASSEALWPGRVRLDGETYAAAVVTGPGTAVMDGDGILATASLTVEISRSVLATAPVAGAMIEDLADGRRYEIISVLAEAARWLIRAAIFPR